MTAVTVVFGDRGATARPGDLISFGRSTTASLKLDMNRVDGSLSRICGIFRNDSGVWRLVNAADRTSFEVNIDGDIQASVGPGASPLPLPSPCSGTVQVQTTQTYVLDFVVSGEPARIDLPASPQETTTLVVADQLGLTGGERRLLLALATPRLRDSDAAGWRVPSTSDLQLQLELTPKQIENLINGLTLKLSPYVNGLIGSNRGRANTRRHQIVDFAIRSGCITSRDLTLPENPDIQDA